MSEKFEPTHEHGMCIASGCRMLGTMSNSTQGGDGWLCSLHFGKPAGAWGRITHGILAHVHLADAMTDCKRARYTEGFSKVFRDTQGKLAVLDPELCRKAQESFASWMRRLDAELTLRVHAPSHTAGQAERTKHPETWAKVGAHLPQQEAA